MKRQIISVACFVCGMALFAWAAHGVARPDIVAAIAGGFFYLCIRTKF
jgi:hypothetical protein